MTFSPTFTPKFSAQFIEPVIENLLALVAARQTYALGLIADGLTLPDFAYIYNSKQGVVLTKFPALIVMSSRTEPEIQEDDSFILEKHEIDFGLGLDGPNANEVRTKVYRYVRAIDNIWRSATSEELQDGMNTDPPARPKVGGAGILQISHSYDDIGLNKTTSKYFGSATITVQLAILETQ